MRSKRSAKKNSLPSWLKAETTPRRRLATIEKEKTTARKEALGATTAVAEVVAVVANNTVTGKSIT